MVSMVLDSAGYIISYGAQKSVLGHVIVRVRLIGATAASGAQVDRLARAAASVELTPFGLPFSELGESTGGRNKTWYALVGRVGDWLLRWR